MAQPQLQVRINEAVLDELNALVPLVQADPNFRSGRITTRDVARLALSIGLEELKRRYPAQER
jgi:hypothetical protein